MDHIQSTGVLIVSMNILLLISTTHYYNGII
jgi:hypothetical protein